MYNKLNEKQVLHTFLISYKCCPHLSAYKLVNSTNTLYYILYIIFMNIEKYKINVHVKLCVMVELY